MSKRHPTSRRVCVRRAKQDPPRRARPAPWLSQHRRWERPRLSELLEDEVSV